MTDYVIALATAEQFRSTAADTSNHQHRKRYWAACPVSGSWSGCI